MAGNKRTVEFVLRARDEASAAFKTIQRALGDVANSQEDISDDLAKVNPQYRELRSVAQQLAGAYKDLQSQAVGLGKALRQQEALAEVNAELSKQSAVLAESADRQAAAAAAAQKAGVAYSKQAAELRALRAEQDALNARQKELGAAAQVVAQFEKLAAEIDRFANRQAEARVAVSRLTVELREQESARAELAAAGFKTSDMDAKIKATTAAIRSLNSELSNTGKKQGIEQRLNALNAYLAALSVKAEKAGVSTADLVKPLAQIEAEIKATAAASNALNPALARVNGAFNNAAAAAKEAGAALQQADTDLSRAQGGYDRVAKKANGLRAALDPLEQELKEAGVATDRLADEQQRLSGELERTKKSAGDAAGAQFRLARETQRSAEAAKRGFELQRTSLSVYQRLRGQVLGLTAAYIGLYGIANQVTQAFKAGGAQRGIENTFAAVNNGDTQAAAEELQYTKKLADELGQEYLALADSYAKYRAAIGDKLPLEQQRFLFEAVAKSATVMRLSTEDAEGTFRALGQIFSKGKITAEELRQQLGDRLPGAMRLLSSGLGITEAELNKLMETGNLTADNMLYFAKAANTAFGAGLAKALETPQAQLNRLLNRVTDLRIAFEQAAEEAGLGKALKDIADALSDPRARAGVEALAQGVVRLLEGLPVLISNFDALVGLLAVLASAKIATVFFQWFTQASLGIGVMAKLNALVLAGAGAWRVYSAAALGVIGILYTLYETLDSLVETNAAVRRAAVVTGGVLVRAWQKTTAAINLAVSHIAEGANGIATSIEYAVKIVYARIKAFVKSALAGLDILVTQGLNKLLGGAGDLADALGLDDTAAKLRAKLMRVNADLLDDAAKANAEVEALEREKATRMLGIADAAEAQREKIRRKERENAKFHADTLRALSEEGAKGSARGRESVLTGDLALGDPNLPPAKADKASQRLRDTLEDLLEKVREKMNDIAAEVERGGVNTLRGEFRAIEQEYAKLLEDISTLGREGLLSDEAVAQYQKQIARIKEIRQEAATKENIRDRSSSVEGLFSFRDQQIVDSQQAGDTTSVRAEQEREELRRQMFAERQLAAVEVLGAAEADLQAARATSDAAAIAAAEYQQAQAEAYYEFVLKSQDSLREKLITADQVNGKLADGLTDTAFALADAAANGASLSDAFEAAGDAFRSFAAQFLREIANMIMRAVIFRALSGGALGGGIAGLVNSAVAHSGAVVGASSANRTRSVSPAWFANAQRFHSGGLPGLRSDEVPAILQRGEEVLSKSDPRNIMNGGGARGGASNSRPQDIKIINTIDAGSMVNEGLSTPEGVKAVMNVVRANKSAFKSALA